MQDDLSSKKDEALSKLLRTWKPEAPLPPRFQEAVWNRITRAEAREASGHWTSLIRWVEATFARPKFAVSYVSILLGLGTGLWQAHGRTAQGDIGWRARYVQMVDPYQMPRH